MVCLYKNKQGFSIIQSDADENLIVSRYGPLKKNLPGFFHTCARVQERSNGIGRDSLWFWEHTDMWLPVRSRNLGCLLAV